MHESRTRETVNESCELSQLTQYIKQPYVFTNYCMKTYGSPWNVVREFCYQHSG